MQRRLTKDSDGVEKLSKSARGAIEDSDGLANEVKEDYDLKHEMLQTCLNFFTDPTDTLRTVLVGEFETAKKRIDELIAKKNTYYSI